jgi:hypothetical protein
MAIPLFPSVLIDFYLVIVNIFLYDTNKRLKKFDKLKNNEIGIFTGDFIGLIGSSLFLILVVGAILVGIMTIWVFGADNEIYYLRVIYWPPICLYTIYVLIICCVKSIKVENEINLRRSVLYAQCLLNNFNYDEAYLLCKQYELKLYPLGCVNGGGDLNLITLENLKPYLENIRKYQVLDEKIRNTNYHFKSLKNFDCLPK